MADIVIPETIQDAVDQYLELYTVSKQLEERMKELRSPIEAFMKEQQVPFIFDRQRTGKVQLGQTDRATATARYTTYALEDVLPLLPQASVEKCVVQVVDKDKLEALAKLGEVPSVVLEHKATRPSYSFSVRIDKR